jgi:hypothetical protein
MLFKASPAYGMHGDNTPNYLAMNIVVDSAAVTHSCSDSPCGPLKHRDDTPRFTPSKRIRPDFGQNLESA